MKPCPFYRSNMFHLFLTKIALVLVESARSIGNNYVYSRQRIHRDRFGETSDSCIGRFGTRFRTWRCASTKNVIPSHRSEQLWILIWRLLFSFLRPLFLPYQIAKERALWIKRMKINYFYIPSQFLYSLIILQFFSWFFKCSIVYVKFYEIFQTAIACPPLEQKCNAVPALPLFAWIKHNFFLLFIFLWGNF